MFHSAFYVRTRIFTRLALRTQGYSRPQINAMLDAADDATIDQAVAESGTKPPGALTVGMAAIGDGHIIDAILEFLKSPEGQALISALIKILLAVIAA